GYGFMKAPKEKGGHRINFDILGGLPIYRETTNTVFPGTTFNSTSGYRFEVGLSWGYMFYPSLDVGIYLDYKYIYFDSDEKTATNRVTGNVEQAVIAENLTQMFHYGVALS
ncbi:MAG: hypothetical protein JSU72_13640, partial [Deltaproteobacteria bacterium]